jgi:hypothetical protein
MRWLALVETVRRKVRVPNQQQANNSSHATQSYFRCKLIEIPAVTTARLGAEAELSLLLTLLLQVELYGSAAGRRGEFPRRFAGKLGILRKPRISESIC